MPVKFLADNLKLSESETKKTLLGFFALFFLLISYYLVKPLRNSQFLEHFDADLLPFVFLMIAFVSLGVTKFYGMFYGKVDRRTLITGAYGVILLLHVLFHALLASEDRLAVAFFYVFASVYFLLALALMWACINHAFSPEEGERCYGYVAAGATLGGIAGAELSSQIVSSWLRDYALILAGVLLLISLTLARSIVKRGKETSPVPVSSPKPKTTASSKSWFKDLGRLVQDFYIRGIATMVFGLAFFNSVMEFQMSVQIDQNVSRMVFERVFVHAEVKFSDKDFQLIYDMRSYSQENQKLQMELLATRAGLEPGQIESYYRDFRSDKELELRSFYANVYRGQGYLSVILLTLASRLLFTRVGLRFIVLILPMFCLLALAVMSFPAEIIVLQTLMILGGSMNYSLNNATKELLYTQTDEQAKFQIKPLIEGPTMRFGDVSASLSKLFIWFVLGAKLGWTDWVNQMILFCLVLMMVLVWMVSVYRSARDYDQKRKRLKV